MSRVTLDCFLSPMKAIQADGLVRTEMNVHRISWRLVLSEYRRRLPVTVVTAKGRFQGGIRKRKDGMPYLCCNLFSEHDGSKISLTKMLYAVGIKPGDKVQVEVLEGEWIVLKA